MVHCKQIDDVFYSPMKNFPLTHSPDLEESFKNLPYSFKYRDIH